MSKSVSPATLRVGYAYPTSPRASQSDLGRDGLWYFVACDSDGDEIESTLVGCASKDQAIEWARIAYPELPWSFYSQQFFPSNPQSIVL